MAKDDTKYQSSTKNVFSPVQKETKAFFAEKKTEIGLQGFSSQATLLTSHVAHLSATYLYATSKDKM